MALSLEQGSTRKQSLQPGRKRERGRVPLLETHDLETEGKACDVEDWQRKGRDAQVRADGDEDWIARGLEPHRSRARCRQGDATVARRRAAGIRRSDTCALGDEVLVLLERHRFRYGQPFEGSGAEAGAIALAIDIQGPASFPRVDLARPGVGIRYGCLELVDSTIGVAGYNLHTGAPDLSNRRLEAGTCLRQRHFPAGGFQQRETARPGRRRGRQWPAEAGEARITPGASRDLAGNDPGILERGGQGPIAALTQPVVAAASIQAAEAGLEAKRAAVARGTQDRADYLSSQRGRHHPDGDRGCGPAARSAGRARKVPGIAGATGLSRGELCGDRFADDHGASLARRSHGCSVAAGAPASEERRSLLGWHVHGLDDVLDAERHAVDIRQGPSGAPACLRAVGGSTGSLEIEGHEGADRGLELRDTLDAALEIGARSIAAGCEVGNDGEEWATDRHRMRHGASLADDSRVAPRHGGHDAQCPRDAAASYRLVRGGAGRNPGGEAS